ncbi:SCO family protein [Flavivirga spongiicola]|uniref:SCO family protein n=1 Tax=Flavivirga spongiicola TaxID=421621 RepID=A0ABU7XNZ2_9FLAO|nr:SCO family protein [Flavivirga sp. MEBiC05379]MDO5981802.1 SCO family protein [Flavivirga sp. MEBiC05379]
MKLLRVLILLLILSCQNNSEKLPVLSYKIDDSGNKTHYSIKYEGFTNQLNETFGTKNIENKVFISNFFFTRCPSICPPMRDELIDIAKAFKNNHHFMIVSHTIDPKNDSISVLKSYSESTEIPNDTWQFLYANTDKTRDQANQFITDFKPKKDGLDFYHSSYVSLVDKKQSIRGFYNILVDEEVNRLKRDISFLLSE